MQCLVPVATGQVVSVICELQMTRAVHYVDFLLDEIIRDASIFRRAQRKANITSKEGCFRQGRKLVSGTIRVSNIGAAMPLILWVRVNKIRPRLWAEFPATLRKHRLNRGSSTQGRLLGFVSFEHLP